MSQLVPQIKGQVIRGMWALGWQRTPKRELDPEFWSIYRQCEKFTMTSVERCYALYQAVAYVNAQQVPGQFVECGTWRGGSSMLAALTARRVAWEPDFVLFDTFAGMAKPDQIDGSVAIASWANNDRGDHNEWCYASEQEVRDNLLSTGLSPERLSLIKGPVEDTLPAAAPSTIALLRLDTDWYSSTLHELEHLYPRLAPGGVLIIDDYGGWEGARRAVDEYFAVRDGAPMLTRVDSTGRVAVKPQLT